MDLSSAQGLMAGLKAATDITRALYELKVTADVQAKVIELQSALMAAQTSALSAIEAQYELRDKVRELEAKLKDADGWAVQEARYTLVNPWRGPAQVYALRAALSNGEPAHYLCTNCFHGRKRVIVNPQSKDGWVFMVCPSCKSSVDTRSRGVPAAVYAEDVGRDA